MKKRTLLCFLGSVFPLFLLAQGLWTRVADFPGENRIFASYFSIGGTGFIAGGRHRSLSGLDYNKDFYAYDQETDKWTRLPDLPYPVTEACSFSIGNKGYIVGGRDTLGFRSTMLVWDNSTRTWSESNPLPTALSRAMGVAFSINGKGYVATGMDPSGGLLSDLWEYDPQTGGWNQKASLPWWPRLNATSFTIHECGYVIGGMADFFQTPDDLCCYNTQTDTWTLKTACPEAPREGIFGFSLGAYGYFTRSWTKEDSYSSNKVWQYDKALDSWLDVKAFPGPTRANGASLCINNVAYLVTGEPEPWSMENWRYVPSSLGIEHAENDRISFHPNPVENSLNISFDFPEKGNLLLEISDLTGKKVYTSVILKNSGKTENTLELNMLAPGCYFLMVLNNGCEVAGVKKLLKR